MCSAGVNNSTTTFNIYGKLLVRCEKSKTTTNRIRYLKKQLIECCISSVMIFNSTADALFSSAQSTSTSKYKRSETI